MRNNLTNSNTEYYFAYGSNMDEHKLKIERNVDFYEKFSGKLDGWKLVFDKIASGKPGVAYSNISPKENSCVEGIIYKIKSEDILNKLDKDEGWPKHYEKKYMLVKTVNGFLECQVYIANSNQTQSGLKPEKKYLNEILAGKEFLSDTYYSELKNTLTCD
jgi:cation transport regulator ChaC